MSAPVVTVDTPHLQRYSPYMRGRDGNEHAAMTADGQGQYVKHEAAIAHTARAVADAVDGQRTQIKHLEHRRDLALKANTYLSAKLAAVWKDIENIVEAHTGAPVVGEPMDALEAALPAQSVAGELPPLPEPASTWTSFPYPGTAYYTKPQMIKAMRDVQFAQSVQQPAAVAQQMEVALPQDEQAAFEDAWPAILARGDANGWRGVGCAAWLAAIAYRAVSSAKPAAYADPAALESFQYERKKSSKNSGPYARKWMWANPATKLVPLYTAPVPAAGVQPTVPTDISARLREYAGNPGYSHNDYADTMRIAADECERFYGGMMAWKKTAETKDRKLSEEINARISERVEARLTEQAAGVMPRPSDDALWDETIRNRDYNADVADQLAACIAEYFGADIGEHSSANDPWHEAMRVIEEAPPLVVQQPDSGRDAALVRVLEGYAKNYDMMSRIGKTGDVDCRSVAHDIRRNMVDGIRKVLAAHPAPSSDAVLVHKAQSILAKHLPPDGPDANTTIRSLLDLLDGPESRTTHPANGAREAAEQRQRERVAEKFANRKATPATADFDLPAQSDQIDGAQAGLSDEEIIRLARLASSENFYEAGVFTEAKFTKASLVCFGHAILATTKKG